MIPDRTPDETRETTRYMVVPMETRLYLAEELAVEVVPSTGEVIEERALTAEERQGSLRLVDGEPCEVVAMAPGRPGRPRAKKS